ncbi:hypothetical protein GGI35DRAFT_449471 [Trichoderma velutinum]
MEREEKTCHHRFHLPGIALWRFFLFFFSLPLPYLYPKVPPLQGISSSLFFPLMSPSTGCILHILTQY